MRQRSIFSLSVLTVPLCHQAGNATTPAVTKMRLKNVDFFFRTIVEIKLLRLRAAILDECQHLGGAGGEGYMWKPRWPPVAENVRSWWSYEKMAMQSLTVWTLSWGQNRTILGNSTTYIDLLSQTKLQKSQNSYLNCQPVGKCDSQCSHIALITISKLWFYQQNRSSLFTL